MTWNDICRWTDTADMAEKVYEMCAGMDADDHAETKESDVNDLEYALFYLKTAAQNSRNHPGFKALFTALAIITEEV